MQLYHITLNNLRRRKTKMLFVLLGLIIGIATIVSVYGIVEAMKTEMTRQVSEFGVNVIVTPDSSGLTFSYGGITFPEIMYDVEQLTTDDMGLLDSLPSREMIRVMAPKLLGMDILNYGQRVIIVGANIQEEFMVKPWLRIRDESHLSPDTESVNNSMVNEAGEKMDFEALDLTLQDLEALDLSDSQVILGAALASALDVSEGDYITLSGKELEVYGVLLESGSEEDQQILMNLRAAQELLGRTDEITVIEMAVDYMSGTEEVLISEINQALPHAHVTSLRQETLRRDEMLGRLVRFGMAISVLVLLVGMMVVSLTMASSVRERTREIGVFRALGFRRSHIGQMILMEGALMSIVGGVIGFLGGTLIARYAGPLLVGSDIQVPWRADLLLIAISTALLIGVLSSIYPAYQATKQDPAEALRFI